VGVLEALEVGLGIEEAVGMVDAQAGEKAFLEEVEWEFVGGVEDFGELHAEGGEVVDV
jgi:hypothetical protein